MRRANTTFVDLRSTLDEVDPLVEASKPVAKRLQPFLSQARAFAADAEPTVRDLSLTIRRRGGSNDLINLLHSFPPLADIATATKQRTYAPGGRNVDVGETRGAFQETVDALKGGAGEIGFARPYTTDFLGWFDDFSTTGGGFDALGATARGMVSFAPSCTRTRWRRSSTGAARVPPRRPRRTARTCSPRPSVRRSAARRATGRCPSEARARGDWRCWACAPARSCWPAPRTRAPRASTYKIKFDNAFGLVKGGDFRVGGVNAGQTTDFEVEKKKGESPKAIVTVEITKPGFGDFRKDASCEVRPQSLIGEYYVDCQPGKSDERLPDGGTCRWSRPPRRSPRTSSTTSCAAPTASASG